MTETGAMQIEYDLTLSDARRAFDEWRRGPTKRPITLGRIRHECVVVCLWVWLLYRLAKDLRPAMLTSGLGIAVLVFAAICLPKVFGLPRISAFHLRWRRNTVLGRNCVTIDADRLAWRRSSTDHRVPWSAIMGISRSPSAIVLPIYDGVIYISLSCFASVEDADTFYTALYNFHRLAVHVDCSDVPDPNTWLSTPASLRRHPDITGPTVSENDHQYTASTASHQLTMADIGAHHWHSGWRTTLADADLSAPLWIGAFTYTVTGWIWAGVSCFVVPLALTLGPVQGHNYKDFQSRQPKMSIASDFVRCRITRGESVMNSGLRDFTRVERNRNGDIYLTPLGGNPIIIPLRAFANRTASDAFYELFREAWMAARKA